MLRLSRCATLVEEGEVVVFFALLRGGTEEVVLGAADLEREGVKVFLLVGRVEFLGGCSSEDSENTGVPCLKGVFSESESENPSDEEEEEISSMTGVEDFVVLGVEWKAILADLRVGLADFGGEGAEAFEG